MSGINTPPGRCASCRARAGSPNFGQFISIALYPFFLDRYHCQV
jgi:hypothetical protein